MLVLRCTARLRARLSVEEAAAPQASTTRLGDWYANLLHVGRTQLVLAVSEQTYLPVVIDAAPARTLVARFRVAAADAMRALDLPAAAIAAEEHEMENVVFARTANRRVVGTMVDLAKLLEWTWNQHPSPPQMTRYLAHTVCLSLQPVCFPAEATKLLFGVARSMTRSQRVG
jgi:hypothetical protein